ncbi:MAG: DUF1674 domain-containing protein [Pseudomonadota bacterium]
MEVKVDAQDETGATRDAVPNEERVLTPAAQRALAEAEERRRQADMVKKEQAKELGGREGPDPVRYGDWENDGITSDF